MELKKRLRGEGAAGQRAAGGGGWTHWLVEGLGLRRAHVQVGHHGLEPLALLRQLWRTTRGRCEHQKQPSSGPDPQRDPHPDRSEPRPTQSSAAGGRTNTGGSRPCPPSRLTHSQQPADAGKRLLSGAATAHLPSGVCVYVCKCSPLQK